jgi:hypothetical protein
MWFRGELDVIASANSTMNAYHGQSKGSSMLILLLALLVYSPGLALGPEEIREGFSTATIISLEMVDTDVINAMGGVGLPRGYNSGIVMSLERRNALPKFSVKQTSVSVAAALDAIAAADGYFQWAIVGNVLHLSPRSPEEYKRFPNFRLLDAKFDFKASAPSVTGLWEKLIDSAQERKFGPLFGYPKRKSIDRCEVFEHPNGFSVDSQGGTLRDVLDAIVAVDPPSGWRAYPWQREGRKAPSGFQGSQGREGLLILISSGHGHVCPAGPRKKRGAIDDAPAPEKEQP